MKLRNFVAVDLLKEMWIIVMYVFADSIWDRDIGFDLKR